VKTRICVKCEKEKLITEFYKDKTTIDKLDKTCKECRLDSIKQWKKLNHEKVLKHREKFIIKRRLSKKIKGNG